jgi:hypothetical protein
MGWSDAASDNAKAEGREPQLCKACYNRFSRELK